MAIETDRKTRDARASKYGIAVREDGHVNKPTQWDAVADSDFADPVNYAYPMDTPERARAALRYWGKRKDFGKYSEADRKVIEGRMAKLADAQGVTANFQADGPLEWDDMTYRDKESCLASALATGGGNVYIQDFDNECVTYQQYPANNGLGSPTTYQRDYAWLDDKLTFGEATEVQSKTIFVPVANMSTAEFSDDGDMAVYEGKVSEVGTYPDKGIEFTEEDFVRAAASFSPVNNDLEHKRTILDGHLGTLQSISAKGKELFAKVAVPKWLKDVVGDKPIGASLAWDRETKRIVGNGLVLNPRIEDAQLVAAFNAANDAAKSTKGGAVDMTDTKKQTWWERAKALFTADDTPDELKSAPITPDPTPPKPDGSADFAADLKAANDRASGYEAALLKAAGVEFADAAIKECKAFPTEKESLIALFVRAAKDDNAGVACFAADGTLTEGERVKELRKMIDSRPAHQLVGEVIEGKPELTAIFACTTSGGDGEPSKERVADLVAKGAPKVAAPKNGGT